MDKKPSSSNGSAFIDVAVEEATTADADEDVGEVEKILGSRVSNGVTQYLIQWKDEHPDSWEPAENISPGIIEDYIGVRPATLLSPLCYLMHGHAGELVQSAIGLLRGEGCRKRRALTGRRQGRERERGGGRGQREGTAGQVQGLAQAHEGRRRKRGRG